LTFLPELVKLIEFIPENCTCPRFSPLFFAQRRKKICQKKNSLIEYGPAFHGKLEQWLSALDGNFEQNHEK
jgi:hypothetical protein